MWTAVKGIAGSLFVCRDLGMVKQRIADTRKWRSTLRKTMAEQNSSLSPDASLVPISIHRYIIRYFEPDSSVVLSIWDAEDAVFYGFSPKQYREREFLQV